MIDDLRLLDGTWYADPHPILTEMLLILIGGDETTRYVISGGMLALLENLDQFTALRDGKADITVAVEEMIRWVSPVQNMGRTAMRDVTIRDQQINEGDQLMLFYPSANRDEEVFDDPQRFELVGRLPDLQLAPHATTPRRESNFVSGPETMPVAFAPAPVGA